MPDASVAAPPGTGGGPGDEAPGDRRPQPADIEVPVIGRAGTDLEAPRVALGAPWCRWTALVGLLAFGVRLIVVLTQPVRLVNDSADYQRLAVSLASGHGFGTSHFAPGGGPTALRPPLFPLVVAGVYKVVGTHLVAARVAEAALGALAVVLLVVVTWLLWGRAVGLTAGVVAAVFPPQVMATTSLMSEAVALPLEMVALLTALCYRRSGRLWWAVGSGAALGLLVLDRPSLAIMVVPLGLLLYRHRPPWRQLSAVGVLVLAGGLVVTPWLVRDRLALHHWVPLTTQSGYVLSGTYNPTSAGDRVYPAAWRPANADPAIADIIKDHPHAQEVQLDGLLESSATHYLRTHPSYLATVMFENTRRLFDLIPPAQVRAATASEYGYGGSWGDAEMASGVLVLVLALAGLIIRRGRRVPVAYLLAPLLLWLSTVVLQAVPRFRAVIDPFLIELAAVALVALFGVVRRDLGFARPPSAVVDDAA